MNFKATVSSIAAPGGIRPGGHITARPVTAIKAGPVAHYSSRSRMGGLESDAHARSAAVAQRLRSVFLGRVPCCHRMVVGSAKLAMRQPCLTLTGQRSYTDERRAETQHTATSRSGGCWTCLRVMRNSGCRFVPRLFLLFRPCNLGNPCAEKVRPHRARQNNVSEPALVAGVGDHWQGTLTITGSNVRLGTEMPAALSLFP